MCHLFYFSGVFVRIKDKNLHPECFKCSTCGASLKNIGKPKVTFLYINFFPLSCGKHLLFSHHHKLILFFDKPFISPKNEIVMHENTSQRADLDLDGWGEGGDRQILYTLKRDHIDKFFKPISTDFIFLFCGLTDGGGGYISTY